MRRLVRIWQYLSTRERILAGAAGAFLVLVAIRFGVVDPYRAYALRLEERIEREANRVRQLRERQESAPQVSNYVEGLRQRFAALQTRFIPETNPALAAARLQERLQSLAGQSGLELVTTQVMKVESIGEFRKAIVQVTLRGELPAVANFLAGIEYSDWLLSVSTLELRSTYGIRGRRVRRQIKGKTTNRQQESMTITLKVGGVMQQTDAS